MIVENDNGVISDYYKDLNTGIPIVKIKTEKQTVNSLKNVIQLMETPDEQERVTIVDSTDMIEVDNYEDLTEENQYWVDYNNPLGNIYFHPNKKAQVYNIKYGSKGYTLISANKIFTKLDEQGNVVELLSDIIEQGREIIDELLILGGAVQVFYKLQQAIADGNELHPKLVEENTKATSNITNLTKQNTDATNNIAKLTTQNNKADENIPSLTTQNDEADVNIPTLTELNQTATIKTDELNQAIASGDINNYQLKTDNLLATTAKTIVGAINENKLSLEEIKNKINVDKSQTQLIYSIIQKLKNRINIKFACIGDSITYGVGASSQTTTGFPPMLKKYLDIKFGVLTQFLNSGRAGNTVAHSFFNKDFQSAIDYKADLYFIMFGHNDIRSQIQLMGDGYPLVNSINGIEFMIRKIRTLNPDADIVILTEPPYKPLSYGSNNQLTDYNNKLKELAIKYSCCLIDLYQIFVNCDGDFTTMIDNTQHPNDLGYDFMAQAVVSYFDKDATPSSINKILPPVTSDVYKYHRDEWKQIAFSDVNNKSYDRFWCEGTWTSTTMPWTSETDGSSIYVCFYGSECMLYFGVPTGTVSVEVDGRVINPNFDGLRSIGRERAYIPIVCDNYGGHVVRLRVNANSKLLFYYAYCLSAPYSYYECTSPNIKASGFKTAGSPFSAPYSWSGKNLVPNDATTWKYEFNFIGTGCSVAVFGGGTVGNKILATIDGVQTILNGTVGLLTICDNLDYGLHNVVLQPQLDNTVAIRLGEVCIRDNTRLERKRCHNSHCTKGEIVKFPIPYTSIPQVFLNGNGLYATNITKEGFEVGGVTEGIQGYYESNGSVVAY